MIKLNGKELKITKFPDKTSQVWKIPDDFFNKKEQYIQWYFEEEGEFLILAQLKDLLDSKGFKCKLYIDYLPYSRQDKPVSNNNTFGLNTFAKLLNSLNFELITILDPHSGEAISKINNSFPIYPKNELNMVIDKLNPDLICYPDLGAKNKYSTLYDYKYVYGNKVRDQLTGYIKSYKLNGEASNKSVLIVDDICDGGATFVLLSKELKRRQAKSINLFVTHGIFSKGLKDLFESGIENIYTSEGKIEESKIYIGKNITIRSFYD